MKKKRTIGTVLVATAVLFSVAFGGSAANALITWWKYANSTQKVENSWVSAPKASTISGNKGFANGGGGWDLTFRMQTVSAVGGSYLYNWGEAAGWSWVDYGFTPINGDVARSQCRWSSASYSGTQTVGLSCEFYGESTDQWARASGDSSDPILAGTAVDASSAQPAAFPEYVPAEWVARYNGVLSIHEEAGVTYWSATDDNGNPCVVQTVDSSELYGAACTSPEDFTQRGVGLALGGSNPDVSLSSAYLFPEPVTSAQASLRGGAVGPLILAAGSSESIEVVGSSGRTYEVPALP